MVFWRRVGQLQKNFLEERLGGWKLEEVWRKRWSWKDVEAVEVVI